MESRVLQLENDLSRIRSDMSELTVTHKEVYKQQIALDKTVNTLLVKLNDHFDQSVTYDKTIRNIDNTVNTIGIKLAAAPMERHNEIKEMIDPIIEHIDEHDKRFTECGEIIKTDLRREFKNYVVVIWLALIIICSLGVYIIEDAEEHIQERQELILEQLNEHSISSRTYNK